jgi:uroporphyrinogen-III decarboxylase
MINPQFRANGLDNLERVCKGKIPICLDLDRQLFPYGTPYEMKKHVEECVKRLYLPEGGLAINLEIGPDNPLENIKALFEAVNEFKKYR